jgi:hypothetical protein
MYIVIALAAWVVLSVYLLRRQIARPTERSQQNIAAAWVMAGSGIVLPLGVAILSPSAPAWMWLVIVVAVTGYGLSALAFARGTIGAMSHRTTDVAAK